MSDWRVELQEIGCFDCGRWNVLSACPPPGLLRKYTVTLLAAVRGTGTSYFDTRIHIYIYIYIYQRTITSVNHNLPTTYKAIGIQIEHHEKGKLPRTKGQHIKTMACTTVDSLTGGRTSPLRRSRIQVSRTNLNGFITGRRPSKGRVSRTFFLGSERCSPPQLRPSNPCLRDAKNEYMLSKQCNGAVDMYLLLYHALVLNVNPVLPIIYGTAVSIVPRVAFISRIYSCCGN